MDEQLLYQMQLNALAMETINKLATGLALLGGQNIVDQVMDEHQTKLFILDLASSIYSTEED